MILALDCFLQIVTGVSLGVGVPLQFRVLLYIVDHESSVVSGVDGAMILALD